MQPTGTGVADHTRQILSNIQTVLRAAGCSSPSGGLSNIIKATVFLTDMKDFSALNTAWVDVLTQAQRDDGLLVDKQGKQQEAVMPARTCVQVAGLPFGTDVSYSRIEIAPRKETCTSSPMVVFYFFGVQNPRYILSLT